MDSWQTQTSTPLVKFEDSPAESFISTPGDMYPSLFGSDSMNPLDTVMTPSSSHEDRDMGSPDPDETGEHEESGEKKTKKRKSWGQVLPEPKTNLPPRKRAKTEDEKEQRRVERVLRNRRAAQSSRERKRLEVEALMERNKALEDALMRQQKANFVLMEELNKFRRDSGVVGRGSSPLDSLQPSPLTLSQPLFGSQTTDEAKAGMMNDFILMPEPNQTVNPASLSPELTPVPDTVPQSLATVEPATAQTTKTTSPDLTQHPAAVLCDLQCQSAEVSRSWTASHQRLQPALALYLQLQMLLLSACQRPLTLVTLALRANLTLQPTPSILNTIIWLVTLPRHPSSPSSSTSTTTTSSATMSSAALPQARPRESAAPTRSHWTRPSRLSASSTTLRHKSLRKLLTCSPILARPLMDATMELLRLVSDSEGYVVDQVAEKRQGAGSSQSSDDREGRRGQPQTWLAGASLPSREVLLTLLWALRVEERKMKAREQGDNPDSRTSTERHGVNDNVPTTTPNQKYVLTSAKRRGDVQDDRKGKRVRIGYHGWGNMDTQKGWH